MEKSLVRLASYDIFDTTLIRKCGNPENIFYILSKKVFPDDVSLQTDFYAWRIHAEEEMMNKAKEPSLIDIYSSLPEHIARRCNLDDIIDFEKEVEKDNLIANLTIKEDILRKRKEGFQICFISDMYLDSIFLKEVLISQGCAKDEDVVFVSCEYQVSKRDNGELYEIARKYYNNISQWIHHGDNKWSDVKYARRKGIKAKLVDTSYSMAEQRILESYKDYPFQLELSILIGFQRASRFFLGNNSDVNNAADLVASLYIPYIFSLADVIKKDNINSLYFLSRDAYILYELAKVLLADVPDLSIHYLCVSRKALIPACLTHLSSMEIVSLSGRKSIVGCGVGDLLKLLHIPEGIIDFDKKVIRTSDEENVFLAAIEKNKTQIISALQKKRSITIDYLRQEGVIGTSNRLAMVDVGWKGTTRMMLNRLKNISGDNERMAFYYFGYENGVLGSDKGSYHSFIPFPVDTMRVKYWIELIENYYSAAPHGSTMGYKSEGGEIIPIFEKNDNEDMTLIAKTNISVCRYIGECIACCPYVDFVKPFSVWGTSFIKLFDTHPRFFPLDTFKHVFYFDKKFIKRVSFARLARYFCTGSTGLSCIDEFSIYYSWGIRVRRRYTLYTFVKIYRVIKSKIKRLLDFGK